MPIMSVTGSRPGSQSRWTSDFSISIVAGKTRDRQNFCSLQRVECTVVCSCVPSVCQCMPVCQCVPACASVPMCRNDATLVL